MYIFHLPLSELDIRPKCFFWQRQSLFHLPFELSLYPSLSLFPILLALSLSGILQPCLSLFTISVVLPISLPLFSHFSIHPCPLLTSPSCHRSILSIQPLTFHLSLSPSALFNPPFAPSFFSSFSARWSSC